MNNLKLSSNQLFVIALVSLAIMAGFAYLDRTYLPVLFGVVLSVINIFIHIAGGTTGAANVVQGVNLGVPLSTTPTLATATLGSASAATDWPQGVPG